MLSNKLTFSLTSLVLVLMLAVCFPVVAQDGSLALTAQTPAKGMFAVVAKSTTAANNGLDGVTPQDGSSVPDLDDLLRLGGTLVLSIAVNTDTTPATTNPNFTVKTTSTEADIMKLKHSAVITEIMSGLDASQDAATQSQSQWIEIYNHGLAFPGDSSNADALTLTWSYTKLNLELGKIVDLDVTTTADGTSSKRVVLDVVSTTPRFGGPWASKSESGQTTASTNPVAPAKDLVSMYRKINLNGDNYKVHDDGHLDGLGSGVEAGSWEKSAGRVNLTGRFIGSPDSVHVLTGGETTRFTKAPASVSATGVIINEVRNDTSEANLDWIELFYNTEDTAATSQNVENWELSIVTVKMKADGTYHTSGNDNFADESLAVLPKYKMPPGGYLVVYNRDPGKSVKLAGGVNIQDVIEGKHVNKGASHMYVVSSDLDLPNTGKFLILLRKAKNTRANHADANKNLVDYAGNGFFQRMEDHKFDTDVWPFVAWTKPDVAPFGDNTFASRDMSWARKVKFNKNGDYWAHSRADARGHGDDWMKEGFIGAGYDRGRDKIVDTVTSPGTPGYPNVAVNAIADDMDTSAGTDDYAFSGKVSISEIMYDARSRWSQIQWIELYNSSMTETIKLDGWEMEIRNESTDIESYVDSSFEFAAGTMIPPNQTLLLVSSTSNNDVADNYVYNLAENHVKELGLNTRGRRLLSSVGFYLELRAKVNKAGKTEMMTVDQVGNVMVDGAAREHMWDLPMIDDSGPRQSFVRLYGKQEIGSGPEDASDGLDEMSWNLSDLIGAQWTYYGHRDDIGTPGFRLGGPLPVELSTFRPVRNEQTGHVDITWVTQSELNNAGFNILRSESKTGEFKVVNVKGIVAGHGTTSEKHVYTFTDTTAKPNVVYYYQIEDVSLDGNRTTLATTHLRGNVSAAGKVTTTWGDLKTQN